MDKQESKRMQAIVRLLKKEYPGAECSLRFKTPFQLLVATILSAQCTDDRVNKVTPPLFRAYPTSSKMAGADIESLKELVRSTGFYNNKAKNILAMSQQLVGIHGGRVPQSMDALLKLPGVARKTANVVLGNAFGIASGVVVDTHVGRISRRLGFTAEANPVKVENDLVKLVHRSDWVIFSHLLIRHGRAVCQSRRPRCEDCLLKKRCNQEGV